MRNSPDALGHAALLAAAVGTLLATLPLRDADACAPAPPEGEWVGIHREEALIVWDPARKVEHFIRRADFDTTSKDFGFLVPTPTQPQLAEADDAVFDRLRELTRPAEETRVRYDVSWSCLYMFMLGARSGDRVTAADVTVLDEVRVAGLDAAVLEAVDPEALARWLRDHGYAWRDALEPWVRPYVEAGWKITAFKIARGEGGASNRVGSRAVRMSFPTDKPMFPYREPADTRPGDRALRVYLVAPGRFDGTLGDAAAPWEGTLQYAKPLVDAPALLTGALPVEEIPAGAWLNKSVDRSGLRSTAGDLFFTPSAATDPVTPPPIVHTDWRSMFIPVDLIVLVGAVIGLVIWLRRRRRPPATSAPVS